MDGKKQKLAIQGDGRLAGPGFPHQDEALVNKLAEAAPFLTIIAWIPDAFETHRSLGAFSGAPRSNPKGPRLFHWVEPQKRNTKKGKPCAAKKLTVY